MEFRFTDGLKNRYKKTEDIMKVKGIKQGEFNKIKDLIVVDYEEKGRCKALGRLFAFRGD